MNIWYGHLLAAVIHLAQFVVSMYMVVSDTDAIYAEITNHPGPSFSFQFKWLVPFFSLLSVFNHAMYLCRLWSPAVRWMEYSISAGLMFVLIGLMSGMSDLRAIIILLGANVALQYTGYASEIGPGDYSSMWDSKYGEPVAIAVGFVVFTFIETSLLLAYVTTVTSKSNVPPMVHVIVLFMVMAMSSFGILAAARLSNAARNWGYVILSIVSKSFLANATLFGSIRSE